MRWLSFTSGKSPSRSVNFKRLVMQGLEEMMEKLDRLKYFACQYCVDIFELFDELEIHEQLTPVRDAWETGRELSALAAENKSA